MIRLRFVTGDDWISNAIRVGERDGWCTHVEAVMPDGTLLGAHLDGGVQARPAGYDEGKATRALIVDLREENCFGALSVGTPQDIAAQQCRESFYDFLRAQLGKPYDLMALAGAAFDRDWHRADSWFCSELQAAALERCGYLPRLAAIDSHVSPRDLLLVLSGRVDIPNMAGVPLNPQGA
jgi:hypothetical protein